VVASPAGDADGGGHGGVEGGGDVRSGSGCQNSACGRGGGRCDPPEHGGGQWICGGYVGVELRLKMAGCVDGIGSGGGVGRWEGEGFLNDHLKPPRGVEDSRHAELCHLGARTGLICPTFCKTLPHSLLG
jgi:hypothetical protein